MTLHHRGVPHRSQPDQLVRTTWILGIGGLIPFVVGTALVLSNSGIMAQPDLEFAVSAYAAVILSFLGGIRWGAALNETGRQSPVTVALSVLPSIAAWVMVLIPAPWNFVGFALAFIVQGVWDVTAIRDGRIRTPWFARVRLVLTIVVGACMVALAFATNGVAASIA
ncbi:hypothetical protein ASG43_14580 [Aureimonas sp. Leaf454]|uniref:DUF3429 domain-containing protein n=1 Tax=Aureimonas sp. Leaf454 TaxID=1736381 RepID=UPI0006FE5D26|nr:DUF3429 domain-containing protein [Aureimonas sp. Leaf454]KQT44549.1 hypothetical protein ASG43_14580 [Aureimonas sp. Leaf454]